MSSGALTEEGGLWEGRYIDGNGGQARPQTFLLADGGRFGWLESADLSDAPVPAMNGEGFLRTGTWALDGPVLVVTETWRRHFDEETSREDEADVAPPRIRRLALGPCSPEDLASTGAPVGTPCMTIERVPFVRGGDARAAADELQRLR